jgi:hypothetical protein
LCEGGRPRRRREPPHSMQEDNGRSEVLDGLVLLYRCGPTVRTVLWLRSRSSTCPTLGEGLAKGRAGRCVPIRNRYGLTSAQQRIKCIRGFSYASEALDVHILASVTVAMLVLTVAMGLKTAATTNSDVTFILSNGSAPAPELSKKNGPDPMPSPWKVAKRNGPDPLPSPWK